MLQCVAVRSGVSNKVYILQQCVAVDGSDEKSAFQ